MRRARLLVRLFCLAAAIGLALPPIKSAKTSLLNINYTPPQRAIQVLPALSPYVALGSVLARRSLVLALPPVLLALGLVMMRRRLLCNWVCPLGFLNEQAGRLFRRLRLPGFTTRARPGRWIALLTLGGAAAGYPLMLWLDPFMIFTGAFGVLRKPLTLAALVPAIAMGVIVILSAFWRGLWCVRLCPLGATQDMLFVNRKRSGRSGQSEPSGQEGEKTPPAQGVAAHAMPLGRRALLGLGVGAAAGLGARKLVANPAGERPILPPGAADRRVFSGLCIRCGNCVRACPSQIIKPSLGAHGLAALLTPTLNFEQEYCHPDCVACTQVCPSGALSRMTVEAKPRAPIGVAVVRPDSCERAQGGDCAVCIMTCLPNAIRGPRPGEAEWGAAPVVIPEACTGCGACELVCPAVPKAIVIEAIKEL